MTSHKNNFKMNNMESKHGDFDGEMDEIPEIDTRDRDLSIRVRPYMYMYEPLKDGGSQDNHYSDSESEEESEEDPDVPGHDLYLRSTSDKTGGRKQKCEMAYPTESIDESLSPYYPDETCTNECIESIFVPEPDEIYVRKPDSSILKSFDHKASYSLDPNTSFLPTVVEMPSSVANIHSTCYGYFVDENDCPFLAYGSKIFREDTLMAQHGPSLRKGIWSSAKEPQETTNYCWKPSEEAEIDISDSEMVMDENNDSVSTTQTQEEGCPVYELVVNKNNDSVSTTQTQEEGCPVYELVVNKNNDSVSTTQTQEEGCPVYELVVNKNNDPSLDISVGSSSLHIKDDEHGDSEGESLQERNNVDGNNRRVKSLLDEEHDRDYEQIKAEVKIEQKGRDDKSHERQTRRKENDLHLKHNEYLSMLHMNEKVNGGRGDLLERKGYEAETKLTHRYNKTNAIQKRRAQMIPKHMETTFDQPNTLSSIMKNNYTVQKKWERKWKRPSKQENMNRKQKLYKWMLFAVVMLAIPSTQAKKGCITVHVYEEPSTTPLSEVKGMLFTLFIPEAFSDTIYEKEDMRHGNILQASYMVLLFLSYTILTRRNRNPYYDIHITAGQTDFTILVTSDASIETVFLHCQSVMVNAVNGPKEKPQGFLKSTTLPFLSPKWNLKHIIQGEITRNTPVCLTFVVVE